MARERHGDRTSDGASDESCPRLPTTINLATRSVDQTSDRSGRTNHYQPAEPIDGVRLTKTTYLRPKVAHEVQSEQTIDNRWSRAIGWAPRPTQSPQNPSKVHRIARFHTNLTISRFHICFHNFHELPFNVKECYQKPPI